MDTGLNHLHTNLAHLLVLFALVGMILDSSGGRHVAHMHSAAYSVTSYTTALSIIPISFVICIALVFFVKETGKTLDKFTV